MDLIDALGLAATLLVCIYLFHALLRGEERS